MLNLNSVMVGLQYLFLEPNADDPLNKGMQHVSNRNDMYTTVTFVEAAQDLRQHRDQFVLNVMTSMKGYEVKGEQYDRVLV